ncbi:MAG: hypothetical protein ACYTGP_11390 [Planctomycetota bacterium]|jgi:hypothetical protein
MESERSLRILWGRFRRGGELRPLVCLAATVASGLLLAGAGILGGWLFGMFRTDPFPSGLPRIGNVRDDDIGMGSLVAGVAWLIALFWLWRPAVRLNRHSMSMEKRREWGRPIMFTVFIGAVILVASYVVHRQPWDDREWAVTALAMIGGGVALLFWLPTVFGLEHGRPVTGPGGRVNVHCTRCGYSMVGLRDATCPECGREYTIDELISEQGYAE